MTGGYVSVRGEHVTEKTIEKSRFITTSGHVEGEEEARSFISRVSAAHADATHNCHAYIADRGAGLVRASDDGEPSGTAGMPMLEVLRNRGIVYCAVVVTRYFGGIKLGAGGLVRAYSGCVAENLSSAEIRSYVPCVRMVSECDYSKASAVERYVEGFPGSSLVSTEYADVVRHTVAVREELEESFRAGLVNVLSGDLRLTRGERYFSPEE